MHLEIGILVWDSLLLKMDEWLFVENKHYKILLQAAAAARVSLSSNSTLFSYLSR